jgi:hypothetical protein
MDASRADLFPGLQHPATALRAYLQTIKPDTFIILLKTTETIKFNTQRPDDFILWLKDNGIEDILQSKNAFHFFT